MRKDVDGEDVLVGPWKLLRASFGKFYGILSKIDVKFYLCSSLSTIVTASCTAECHALQVLTSSSSVSNDCGEAWVSCFRSWK